MPGRLFVFSIFYPLFTLSNAFFQRGGGGERKNFLENIGFNRTTDAFTPPPQDKGAASPQANISSSLDSLLMCLVVDCRFLPFLFVQLFFVALCVRFGGFTPCVNLLSDDEQTYLPHFL